MFDAAPAFGCTYRGRSRPRTATGLPETEPLAERVLQLSTGTAVADGDIDLICGIVHAAFDCAKDLARMAPTQQSG